MKRSALTLVGAALGLLLAVPAGSAPRPAAAPAGHAARSVSFRHDVAPLFVVSCSTASCHGAGAHPPDLDPDADPSSLRRALLGVASEERPDRPYVKPGDPQASYLVDKIEGRLVDSECADHDCGSRMPARNAALSPEARAAVLAWIADGAPDN
jgi:hypothetical protein